MNVPERNRNYNFSNTYSISRSLSLEKVSFEIESIKLFCRNLEYKKKRKLYKPRQAFTFIRLYCSLKKQNPQSVTTIRTS